MNLIGDVEGRTDSGRRYGYSQHTLHRGNALKSAALKVVSYCTHAVLSGKALDNIRSSQLDELVVTDTPSCRRAIGKIRQLTIADLLADPSGE